MSWLQKVVNTIRLEPQEVKDSPIPDGLWVKCSSCETTVYRNDLERNLYICPNCNHHMAIPARYRLANFLDEGTVQELFAEITSNDVLEFRDSKAYSARLLDAQKTTSEKDALIVASGQLKSRPVIVGAFEFAFMGGSMGSVVGERFWLAAEHALDKKMPFICFSASGGARMQESLFSLMQMARTSAVIAQLRKNHIPFISVLTNPTFGGVTASLAMLGDVNVAEPNALIGFAGPRVIEQTVRQKLPSGFQKSEFLQDHGTVDLIVSRLQMREKLDALLTLITQKSYQNTH